MFVRTRENREREGKRERERTMVKVWTDCCREIGPVRERERERERN